MQPASLDHASTGPSTGPMRQEVRATLAARRELGPEYDDIFVETLVQRLAHQFAPQPKDSKAARHGIAPFQRAPRDPAVASAGQRLFLAMLSLGALMVLAGVLAGSGWGLAGFLLGGAMIALLNYLFIHGR